MRKLRTYRKNLRRNLWGNSKLVKFEYLMRNAARHCEVRSNPEGLVLSILDCFVVPPRSDVVGLLIGSLTFDNSSAKM